MPITRGFVIPKTRTEWWTEKLNKNKIRDEKAVEELKTMGLNVIVVWGCELSTIEKRKQRLEKLALEIKNSKKDLSQ